ncbi:MAG: CHAD domain-containing protein [Deltaproteobacteria bacterium]|nr:CHAD domain-containing protein [Deltaproteobacteria bacterium]MBI3296441.1 CHAD domain-containing protein [Deltaproteobacteria bacterium]
MQTLVTQNDLKSLDASARKTRKSPSIKNVHELRVLIRRVRSQLWLIPKEQRTRAIKKARRDLKKIASLLGEQRKYDVAITDAQELGLAVASLRKERERARLRIPPALKGRKRDRVRKQIREAIRDTNRLSSSTLIPRIERLRKELEGGLPKSQTDRHQLRISVKRARYVLKRFGYNPKSLHELQDLLGRWQDLATLGDLIGPHPRVTRALNAQWKRLKPHVKPALATASRALKRLSSTL